MSKRRISGIAMNPSPVTKWVNANALIICRWYFAHHNAKVLTAKNFDITKYRVDEALFLCGYMGALGEYNRAAFFTKYSILGAQDKSTKEMYLAPTESQGIQNPDVEVVQSTDDELADSFLAGLKRRLLEDNGLQERNVDLEKQIRNQVGIINDLRERLKRSEAKYSQRTSDILELQQALLKKD